MSATWTGASGAYWYDGVRHVGRIERSPDGARWRTMVRTKIAPSVPAKATVRAPWVTGPDFPGELAARAFVEAWTPSQEEIPTAPGLRRLAPLVSRPCEACGGSGHVLVCARCEGRGCEACAPDR
jgi:hypothetical protein